VGTDEGRAASGPVGRLVDIVVPPRMGTAFRWNLASLWVGQIGDGIALISVVTVAAKGGRAPTARQPGALPRLSAEESKARVVEPLPAAPAPAATAVAAPEAPVTMTVEPETQVEVERFDGPGTAFPSLAGGYTRGVPFKRDEFAIEAPAPSPAPAAKAEGPVTEESEWAALPKTPAQLAPPTLVVPMLEPKPVTAPAPAPTPAPVPVVTAKTSSKSLEQLFLELTRPGSAA